METHLYEVVLRYIPSVVLAIVIACICYVERKNSKRYEKERDEELLILAMLKLTPQELAERNYKETIAHKNQTAH